MSHKQYYTVLKWNEEYHQAMLHSGNAYEPNDSWQHHSTHDVREDAVFAMRELREQGALVKVKRHD